MLQKVSTGAGTAASPSGLAKINIWVDTFVTDNTASAVYGGDLQGNLWEFDMNGSTVSAPKKIGQTLDGSNRVQPITTKPALGLINNTYPVMFVGTGRYLGTSDLTDPGSGGDAWQQSLYAIKISPHNSSDTLYGNLRNGANALVKQTITVLTSQTRGTSTNNVNWASGNGWYVDFNPNGDSPGERVNVDPQLVPGDLIVATNVPGGGACSVGGDSFFYQFDYTNGEFTNTSPGGVVGMKLQGAETVGVSIFQTTTRGLGIAVVDSGSGLRQPTPHPPSSSNAAKRSGWREVTPHN
jgi:type IV pilus assembly protein PilY1